MASQNGLQANPAGHNDLGRMQAIADGICKVFEDLQLSSGQARIILSMVKTRVTINQVDMDQRYYELTKGAK